MRPRPILIALGSGLILFGCQYDVYEDTCSNGVSSSRCGEDTCIDFCVQTESDSDGDGLPDVWESETNTSPYVADSDDDGILDGNEDPDGDGYTNAQEVAAFTDPADGSDYPGAPECPVPTCGNSEPPACDPPPACECPPPVVDPDSDGDGLTDATEGELGTDPGLSDTDSDGVGDGAEVDRGTNPLDPDTDGDGDSDGAELDCGSSPLDPYMTCPATEPPPCGG